MQGSMKFALVVLVGVAVLAVLITPAPDELPCTIGRHGFYQAALVSLLTTLSFVNFVFLFCRRAVQ
jgi:hypothetical protein